MNNDLQNIINGAISRGIKLGLELYDEEDISLDKDLTDILNQKRFKVFNPLKNLDKKVKEFLNGDTLNLWLFKKLCCNYNDAYYAIYHIKNNSELLKLLIEKLCSAFGNSINLNWIDVSSIDNMSRMFEKTLFNGDLSKWDVSNVENMSHMFSYTDFNQDISKWDVSNVKNMYQMFSWSKFNGDISNWDISNVRNMSHMFCASQFSGDISLWDISNVKNTSHMFFASHFDSDISAWNITNVKNTYAMFNCCLIREEFKPIKYKF